MYDRAENGQHQYFSYRGRSFFRMMAFFRSPNFYFSSEKFWTPYRIFSYPFSRIPIITLQLHISQQFLITKFEIFSDLLKIRRFFFLLSYFFWPLAIFLKVCCSKLVEKWPTSYFDRTSHVLFQLGDHYSARLSEGYVYLVDWSDFRSDFEKPLSKLHEKMLLTI